MHHKIWSRGGVDTFLHALEPPTKIVGAACSGAIPTAYHKIECNRGRGPIKKEHLSQMLLHLSTSVPVSYLFILRLSQLLIRLSFQKEDTGYTDSFRYHCR